MFAYCGNNPGKYADYYGHFAIEAILPELGQTAEQVINWWESGGREATIEAIEVIGAVLICLFTSEGTNDAVRIIGEKTYNSPKTSIYNKASSNSKINRPSVKKVTLDMDHILSGHSSGGNRGPNKDRFPSWMTPMLIERAIKVAYQNAEKAGSMQYSWQNGIEIVRQFFRGRWNEIIIEFWFNYTQKIIETAWPKTK